MLTLQYIPYVQIEKLTSVERVKKLLKIVKDNKIILLEGKLRSNEEAELIRKTMEEIDDKFKGIEISPIVVKSESQALFDKIKEFMISTLLGDRKGLTIIGPANIVKEIKQDPDKIQLLMNTEPKKKKRR